MSNYVSIPNWCHSKEHRTDRNLTPLHQSFYSKLVRLEADQPHQSDPPTREFLFQIGAIRSDEIQNAIANWLAEFLFQIGAIRSLYSPIASGIFNVSIPNWCD